MTKDLGNTFYTRFNRPKIKGTLFLDPSRTKQEMKEECDINRILKRFEQNGQLPDLIKTNPVYGDFSDVADYQESLNTIRHAQEQFYALSSRVREKFQNDPAKFLDFANNPANGKEMLSLGLATATKIEPKQKPKSDPPKASPSSESPPKAK